MHCFLWHSPAPEFALQRWELHQADAQRLSRYRSVANDNPQSESGIARIQFEGRGPNCSEPRRESQVDID
jgi:hypothetical protein